MRALICHVRVALCPHCYVYWYVTKGRGQATSRTAGAPAGRAQAGKNGRAKVQQRLAAETRVPPLNIAHRCTKGTGV